VDRPSRKEILEKARRVVVKVGSGVLTGPGGLDRRRVEMLAGQIARLATGGRQVVLVSSGAIASGQAKAGLGRAPRTIPEKQAAAALGQAGLVQAYEEAFEAHGLKVAQVLLTADDLRSRTRYLNARNTLFTLLEWGVVPVVNENDTVAVEEIRLGDNDNLAAMLTNLLGAQVMINLTNVDGIMDSDPRTNPQAKLIPVVEKVTPALIAAASSQPGAVGRGGILSKVKAAEKVARCGAYTIVANGLVDDVIDRLLAGHELGTLFLPNPHPLTRRKHWIAFAAGAEQGGEVVVDDGAVRALVDRGSSLLPAGVVDVRGRFGAGAAVRVVDKAGRVVGVGLTNYSSEEIKKIKGLHTSEVAQALGHKYFDELIHRDNLVVFAQGQEEGVECLLKS